MLISHKMYFAFLANLNTKTTVADLIGFFNPHLTMPIDESCVKLVVDPDTGICRGFAHIKFHCEEDYKAAEALHETVLLERNIRFSEGRDFTRKPTPLRKTK